MARTWRNWRATCATSWPSSPRQAWRGTKPSHATEALVVLILAVAAAVAIKVPALFGLRLGSGDEPFYARNASLFVLPQLTAYFAWKRGLAAPTCIWLALSFAAAAIFANVYPFGARSHTEALTALHLPIALWLVVGVAYVGGRWFSGAGRMDFVRFSGELFIYYALIALGGGVLTAFTMMMFGAIGVNAEWLAQGWLIPCGAMGAVILLLIAGFSGYGAVLFDRDFKRQFSEMAVFSLGVAGLAFLLGSMVRSLLGMRE